MRMMVNSAGAGNNAAGTNFLSPPISLYFLLLFPSGL